jgi:hypothetical protein
MFRYRPASFPASLGGCDENQVPTEAAFLCSESKMTEVQTVPLDAPYAYGPPISLDSARRAMAAAESEAARTLKRF